jgi:hypothetical protein
VVGVGRVRGIRPGEISQPRGIQVYGKNYGWALRFRKGGKALLSLYPTQSCFTVQVILSEAAAQATRDLKLGKRVRQVIERAYPFPEGRWLYIPIKSQKDMKDVQQLLAVKLGTG